MPSHGENGPPGPQMVEELAGEDSRFGGIIPEQQQEGVGSAHFGQALGVRDGWAEMDPAGNAGPSTQLSHPTQVAPEESKDDLTRQLRHRFKQRARTLKALIGHPRIDQGRRPVLPGDPRTVLAIDSVLNRGHGAVIGRAQFLR